MNIIPLYLHSTADIITNSSSELFICNTEKNKQEILDYLKSITNYHGVNTENMTFGNGPDQLEKLFVSENYKYAIFDSWQFEHIISLFLTKDQRNGMKFPSVDVYNIARGLLIDQAYDDAIQSAFALREQSIHKFFVTYNDILQEHINAFAVMESDSANSLSNDMLQRIDNDLHAINLYLG